MYLNHLFILFLFEEEEEEELVIFEVSFEEFFGNTFIVMIPFEHSVDNK